MPMLRRILWGAGFVAAGAIVAAGALPSSSSWDLGPRVGISTMFIVLGLTVIGLTTVPWVLRRTTRPADYAGSCPVGATCACGHFNFKPRRACRQCGAATRFVA